MTDRLNDQQAKPDATSSGTNDDMRRDGIRPLLRTVVRMAHANRRAVLVSVCAIIFVMLLEDVLEGDLLRIDIAAYAFFVETLRTPWLTSHMEAFSALATPVSLIAFLLMIVAFAPGKRPGALCALNLVLVVGLNLLLKAIVQRPRPEGFSLAVESGFSFPSGHSMVAMAFFGLLVWIVWRYEQDRTLRIGCCIAFSAIIALVGISRIYLGVHYASDVIGGFCVSLAWLALYTRLVAPALLGPLPDADAPDGATGSNVAPLEPRNP